jgi:cellulose 1,4-beta-cellobiosidase
MLFCVAIVGCSSADPSGDNQDNTGFAASNGGIDGDGGIEAGSTGDPSSGGQTGSQSSGTMGGSTPGTGGTTGAASGDAGGSSTAGTPVTLTGNPFADAVMYVSDDYAAEVDSSIALISDAATKAKLEKLKTYSTAVWLDRIAKVQDIDKHLASAKAQEATAGKPVVTVFVVYDLPNRDCAAKASAGELAGDIGAARYKTEFIDVIAQKFAAHSTQRIVAILEPDSLPNLATNLSVPTCADSVDLYKSSVAYAIRKLQLSNVALYIDTAHSGWLGWDDNRAAIAKIYKEVLEAAGGLDTVRGFATNVANYTPLTNSLELYDYQGNPCKDELTFASALGQSLAAVGIVNKGFVIDTSRNGLGGVRKEWGSWCNINGAGLGARPAVAPAQGIDAYYWVKPPGESDGTSDQAAARFDPSCQSQDSVTPAPEAGTWFHSYALELIKNASPAL